MSTITAITVEAADPAAAAEFYAAAFGLGDRLRVRAATGESHGFRGFALSLVVAQPADVDALVTAAVAGGAEALKPAAKSFWGYGAVLRDPFGVIWKLASSAKRNTGPATGAVSDVVLLLGTADVLASKRFYVERGLPVAKSFGRKYVEFGTSGVKLAMYGRKAAAKDLGVAVDGSGSRRLAIHGDVGEFADPDGFAWEGAVSATVDR